MTNSTPDFDVIIVGCRPAGASLGIRLAQAGYSILLVDKDSFPSKPAISCPVIFANTMQLLDELDIQESDYAKDTPKVYSFSVGVADYFDVDYEVPTSRGRNYVYCIDRGRFDNTLLTAANSMDNVSVLEGFKVNNLIFKNDTVKGIIGRHRHGESQQFTARCVVGADGRFSTIARLVNSPIIKEWKKPSSAVLYSYWQGIKPMRSDHASVQLYVPESGLLYMLLDSAENTTGVIIHGEQRKIYGQAEDIKSRYHQLLSKENYVWDRLQHGQPIDKLRGIRNLRNLYRQAGGSGWFLTGDAFHQRDTLDAQGIYEALLFSKLLSNAIEMILTGKISCEQAADWYQQAAFSATAPMCKATLKRLIWQHRIPWPGWFIKSIIRWLFCDDDYKERFIRLHLRDVDPKGWIDGQLVLKAIWRGINQDIFSHGTAPGMR